MNSEIYSDLRTVIREVTGTDRDHATTGTWWGLVLQDLHLALGSRKVVHVEWLSFGELNEDYTAQVLVFTEDLIALAEYKDKTKGMRRKHFTTVWPRKDLANYSVSGTNGAGDHDGTGRVEVELTLSDGKEFFLPLQEYTWDQKSLKALIATLPADLVA